LGNEAEDLRCPLVSLRTLAWQDQPKLAVALAPLLAELDVEPSGPHVEPFDPETDAHVAWANRDHILYDARRETHYLRHIVVPLSRYQRERAGLETTVRLATAVGMFPGAVTLAALLHDARAVCLVTTDRSASIAARVVMALLQVDPDVVVHEVREQHSVSLRVELERKNDANCATWADAHLTSHTTASDDETVAQVADWLARGERSRVDITAGRAIVSAILVAAARRANSEAYYIGHTQKGNVPLYGTERLVPARWAVS
jgi:hypothetical protein